MTGNCHVPFWSRAGVAIPRLRHQFFFAAPAVQAHRAAADLRDRIRETAKLPVTVGIARTRTLAKLFSDTAKPFGARAVLDPGAEVELLATLPVTEISGIAGRRAARLEPYGVRTCLDLRRADRLLVRQLLTRTGEALWYELNGVPVLPIQPQRPAHKALSRGGSLGGATADPGRLYAWLVRNLERLIEELEFHAVKVGRLSVFLSYADGETAGDGPLDAPSDRFDLLLDAARVALRRAWLPGRLATHMHLVATRLRSGVVQRSLFEPPADRAEAVAKVKREVNAAVGRFSLRSGATLPLTDIYADPTNAFDICDVRGKHCF
jgi:DNA polymerase V